MKFEPTDDVVLMVNNMRGISNLELGYTTEVISEQLIKKYNNVPKRTISGTFITTLNGPGFGITLLNASKAGADIIKFFDYPTTASRWNQMYHKAEEWKVLAEWKIPTAPALEQVQNEKSSRVTANYDTFAKILLAGIDRINEVEPKVTWYDTIAGDGDCGTTLVSGGEALSEAIKNRSLRLEDAALGIEDIV